MFNNRQAIHLKKEILIRLAKAFLSDDFKESARLIPYDMRPKGCDVPYRCCIHKERAILKDRVIAGLGFAIEEDNETTLLSEYASKSLERKTPEDNPLTILDAACKGCVPNRIYVTELCQGCIARSCQRVCKFGAISIVNGRSVIDGSKCKNCKICIGACPYNAIVKIVVPCEDACPVGAITKDEHGHARIDFNGCIFCGKCLSACPFGAVHEKSQMIDVLKAIKSKKEVIALIAPSIMGQFPGTIYQLKSAMKQIGFSDVYEVAQGADITSKNEAEEFREKMAENTPFMTTSCCAGYREFAKKHLPEIEPFVSETKTPLHYIAQKVKSEKPESVTVFISPCTAKRVEGNEDEYVDFVMNFEELGAVFVAQKIEILNCEESSYDCESSKEGRRYGISGGVAAAVNSLLDEPAKSCLISGLDKDNIKKLKKFAKDGVCDEGNLVEVMCCEGGCIGGNGTINQQKAVRKVLDDFCS